MADPIAIVGNIIKLADRINKMVDEVKAFPDLVKKLDFKIQLMKPSLDFLSNMSSQKGQLLQYCKDDPNLHLFAHSLTQIFDCIKEVDAFINKIKGMSNLEKMRKKDSVYKTYNDLDWKLNELHKSIQFSLLTEVKADVNKGADPVQTLVKHARKSGAFSSTTGSPVDGQPKHAKDANPAHIRGWVYNDNKRPDDINTDARKVIDDKTPKEITILMRECWDTSPERRPTSQDIQKMLTSAYEKKYNAKDLRNADTAIYQQMDQTNDKPSAQSSSSADSGIGNSAGRLQDLRIGDQDQGAASRDSGFDATAASHAASTQDKPGVTMGASSQQWRVIKKFGKMGDAQGEFRLANGIAVCNNGDIVICDVGHYRVYVFNKDGEYKNSVKSPLVNRKGKPREPYGVAITNGQVVIADREDEYIMVYGVNGTYTSRFTVRSTTESSNTVVCPWSITVSSLDGTVLVGDSLRQVVTIHDGCDGKLKQTAKLDIRPLYLATNGCHHIIVCDYYKVQCVDYAGKVMFVIDSFTVDDTPGKPYGVTCDDEDTLYVVVTLCRMGHIHQYSPSGKFVKCIMKGLYWPNGITWHNGRIYIAKHMSVVILGKS